MADQPPCTCGRAQHLSACAVFWFTRYEEVRRTALEYREQLTQLRDRQAIVDELRGQPLAVALWEVLVQRIESADPAACRDCGLPYAKFPVALVLPDADWKRVAPEGGVLCANCIVRRAGQFADVALVRAQLECRPHNRRPGG